MKLINCNPTKGGIILRLLIAFILIVYGSIYSNFWIMALGFIPIIRMSIYVYQKRKQTI